MANIQLVSAGTFASGNNSATPAFGQPTAPGNLLVAWVAGLSTTAFTVTGPSGWLQAVDRNSAANNARSAVWYKPVSTANETAPTFNGSSNVRANVAEFRMVAQSNSVDQTGSNTGTASPLTVTAGAADGGAGRLVVSSLCWRQGSAGTGTSADSLSGAVEFGNNDSTSAAYHGHGWYSLTAGTGATADSDTYTVTGDSPALATITGAIASFAPAPDISLRNITAPGGAGPGVGPRRGQFVKRPYWSRGWTDPYALAVLADGPFAYYRCNDPAGTTFRDFGPNGITLLLNATAAITKSVAGATWATDSDTAVTFTAINSCNAHATFPAVAFTDYTLECWFKGTAANVGGNPGAIYLGNPANFSTTNTTWMEVGSGATTNKSGVALVVNTTRLKGGTAEMTRDGAWHHCVTTRAGTTVTVYLDGLQIATGTAPGGTITATDIALNGVNNNGTINNGIGPGSLDEVAIYPTVLSLARIQARYTLATGYTGPFQKDAILQRPGGFHPGSGPTTARFFRRASYAAPRLQIIGSDLSFSGSIPSRAIGKGVSGQLGFAGSGPFHALSKSLSAGLSFAGSFGRQIPKAFSGALSFGQGFVWGIGVWGDGQRWGYSGAGLLSVLVNKGVSGALSFAGSIPSRAISKRLAAGLGFTGSLARAIAKGVSAALGFTGAIAKSPQKALAGVLGFVGSIPSRAIAKGISASLSFIGSQARAIAKGVSAALSFSGAARKGTARALSGAIGFVGALGHQQIRNLSAALSFTGSGPARAIGKGVSGQLGFSGAAGKVVGKALSGGLSLVGAIPTRAIGKALQSVLSWLGSLVGIEVIAGPGSTQIFLSEPFPAAIQLREAFSVGIQATDVFGGTVGYYVGKTVRLANWGGTIGSPSGGFRNVNGSLYDPPTPTLKYQIPGAGVVSVVGGTLVHDGQGLYSYNVTPTVPGDAIAIYTSGDGAVSDPVTWKIDPAPL